MVFRVLRGRGRVRRAHAVAALRNDQSAPGRSRASGGHHLPPSPWQARGLHARSHGLHACLDAVGDGDQPDRLLVDRAARAALHRCCGPCPGDLAHTRGRARGSPLPAKSCQGRTRGAVRACYRQAVDRVLRAGASLAARNGDRYEVAIPHRVPVLQSWSKAPRLDRAQNHRLMDATVRRE